METKKKILLILVLAFGLIVCLPKVGQAAPMETAFTYQGRLIDANKPADGLYNLQFKLYDANIAGAQKGSTINIGEVDVIDGYFTVLLDFGSKFFDGDARWLEIGVRSGQLNDPNAHTILSPRHCVSPTPYALYAKSGTPGPQGPQGPQGVQGPAGPTLGIYDSLGLASSGGRAAGNAGGRTLYNLGNVGIGTASPTNKLDVAGHINSSESYKLDGTTVLANPGTANTFVGQNAGANNTTGNYNTFSGTYAGNSNTTGYNNTFSGYCAGNSNITGYYNAFSGTYAGAYNTTGNENTFSGVDAGYNNTTGSYNTYSGFRAGYSNTTGYDNTFSGSLAGASNTTGYDNTFSGYGAGNLNTTGGNNTFSGYRAGANNTTGNYNTFSGYQAGYFNTTGSYNTFSGSYAGISNTTGNYNTFSGYQAGYSNTTGYSNTFSGFQAGYSNTTGNDNTFSGYGAGYSNTTGNYNAFSGVEAGYSNTTGNYNTFSGFQAGHSNTTGISNVFSGDGAGFNNTTGSSNSFFGSGAGVSNGAGTDNTYLGYQAGYTNSAGNGNVFVGYQAGYNETGSNKLYIANSSGTPLIYGDFSTSRVGIHITDPTESLDVQGTARLRGIGSSSGTTVVADGNGKLWKQSSSQRYKTNIETLDADTDAVLKLRPVKFQWKTTGQNDIGLIAEEVKQQINDLVIYDNEGRPDGVKYDKVALYLLGVVKAQQEKIAELEKRLETLENTTQQQIKTVKEVQQ